tara:strand:+ start:4578 stop:4895 length:318 start_codon:yes stop_codon:yes gene_type:complete
MGEPVKQADLFRYPSVPGHKVGGASAEVVSKITKRALSRREKIKAILQEYGEMTADEVAAHLGLASVYPARPRLSEMVATGEVIKTERRGMSGHGNSVHLYRLAL